MAIACAGYRVSSGLGHHQSTLEATTGAIPGSRPHALIISISRKRNRIDYERVDVATDSEAEELLEKAKEFYQLVEPWIGKVHPDLKRRES